MVSSTCENNIIKNVTANPCTGEKYYEYLDCTTDTMFIDKGYSELNPFNEPQVCVVPTDEYSIKYAGAKCASPCIEGEIKYKCIKNVYTGYHYGPYKCYKSSNGYNYWSSSGNEVNTCPADATCYNPDGDCQ